MLAALCQIDDRAAVLHLNLANVLQHTHLGEGKKGERNRRQELCYQGVFETNQVEISATQVVQANWRQLTVMSRSFGGTRFYEKGGFRKEEME